VTCDGDAVGVGDGEAEKPVMVATTGRAVVVAAVSAVTEVPERNAVAMGKATIAPSATSEIMYRTCGFDLRAAERRTAVTSAMTPPCHRE
jgi:hypothetical protein